MKLTVDVKHKTYDIILERGCLKTLDTYIDTTKRYFILTDTNIPQSLIDEVVAQCPNSSVYKVVPGEQSKSIQTFEEVCQACLDFHMSRKDTLIALGGGVIGDLGGFVAASYMRGIPFISIPTTTLSQIDSSIGGKTAINLGKVKNIIGSFNHPDLVLIDFDTLATLPKRHIQSGLVEALKAGLIHDKSIYEIFKQDDYENYLDEIVYKALCMKKWVVEEDEKETGLRKTLNFGHSIGHGIEAYYNLETYYHGECVGMGMLYFIDDEEVKKEVIKILEKMGLPTHADLDIDKVFDYITRDKKAHADTISIVKVSKPSNAYIEEMPLSEVKTILERNPL